MEESKRIGARLKNLREYHGLTQKDLCGQMNGAISERQISTWESGTREIPSPTYLIELARFFGVTTDYLLGLTDKKNTSENIDADELIASIVDEVFQYDKHAEYNITHLLYCIAASILRAERVTNFMYSSDSPPIKYYKLCIAILDAITNTNDGAHGVDKDLSLLLEGFREYLSVIFSDYKEKTVSVIKKETDIPDISLKVSEHYERAANI